MYEGKTKDEYTKDKMEEKTLKRRKMAEREQQKKFLANTELRKGRMERLSLKQQEAEDEEEAVVDNDALLPPPLRNRCVTICKTALSRR